MGPLVGLWDPQSVVGAPQSVCGPPVIMDGSQSVYRILSAAFSRSGCFVPNRLWGSQSVCVAPQSVCGAPQSVFGALSGLG